MKTLILFVYCFILLAFYEILPAYGDVLDSSCLKAHPFKNHYVEWITFLILNSSQDSNTCAWRTLGSTSLCVSNVPWLLPPKMNRKIDVFLEISRFVDGLFLYRLNELQLRNV